LIKSSVETPERQDQHQHLVEQLQINLRISQVRYKVQSKQLLMDKQRLRREILQHTDEHKIDSSLQLLLQ
jgi:hypothetical protein